MGIKTVKTFGWALSLLKQGHRVARTGWNGKRMFLYYVPAAAYPAQRNTAGTMIGVFPDDLVPYQDYIAMKTAQDDVVPWVASQSDLLSEDWFMVADKSDPLSEAGEPVEIINADIDVDGPPKFG